ncbi:hypothetical protein B9Z55_027659 [Caenorhabditis nigoni]|uniref:Uncharacterized protein n=1 Tax=Caenorhabditis nigoni TaxID=1611254 RepID=A0A2G5SF17_9PELO|nr:hypothetical protein B9Z55_027659 [Caenorhabditis nigoni]
MFSLQVFENCVNFIQLNVSYVMKEMRAQKKNIQLMFYNNRPRTCFTKSYVALYRFLVFLLMLEIFLFITKKLTLLTMKAKSQIQYIVGVILAPFQKVLYRRRRLRHKRAILLFEASSIRDG